MLKNKFFLIALLATQGLTACSSLLGEDDQMAQMPAKALFAQGEIALAKHDNPEAVQYFEALDTRFPFSPYMNQAQINLIYAYYDLEQYDNAMSVADAYLSLHPHGKQSDYAHYMRGLIQFERDQSWFRQVFHREPALHDLSHLRKAYDDFMKVAKVHHNSSYADDAARRTLYIRNQLAESELFAAKYYYQKHAYIAAVNRLDYLLENFPGAPQRPQVLALKKKAASQLGITEA